ncbi:MAG: indoleamine 2,3-dioxygenase [Pseudomonadota bacterium]
MSLKALTSYDVSRHFGFLSHFEADRVAAPTCLQPAAELGSALPDLLVTGRARREIEALADADLAALADVNDRDALRVSLVHYAFLEQAYVWAEPTPPRALPRSVARPLWVLAERVGQPPILTYSQYVLDNWSRLDAQQAVSLGNSRMVQRFLGGADEAWFVLIHVAIEAAAAPMLARIPQTVQAARVLESSELTEQLGAMVATWDRMIAVFDRMPDYCDPYVYFHRVRPWIHGFTDNPALPNGIVYEGVEATRGRPQRFRGQTGSQSSIVPVMDALLAVGHHQDPLRRYLDELHQYRPPGHRRLIEDVRANSTVRTAVQTIDDPRLTGAYNDCLDRLTRFRTRHLEYAAHYIQKQSHGGKGNDAAVGTGGTPFMKYLKKHRDEAARHRL